MFKRFVILPIGSFERHGVHLPLNTDSIIAERISIEIAKKKNWIVLPPINYSPVASKYPNIGVKREVFQKYLGDILKDLEKNNVELALIILGHGGPEIKHSVEAAAKNVKLKVYSFHILTELEKLRLVDQSVDRHAGEWETSLVMCINEELVGRFEPSEEVHGDPSKASV